MEQTSKNINADEFIASPSEDSTTSKSNTDPEIMTATKNLQQDPPMVFLPKTASWFQQFYWCLWKNTLLLRRRPFLLCLVTLSSVVSMVLSWVAGGKDPDDTDDNQAGSLYPPPEAFTSCGSLKSTYVVELDYNTTSRLQITLNDHWRDGVEVGIMGLGALVQALFVFVVVHAEVHAQLLGVLRALGLRDSVYWLSWYIAFAGIALVNALLGAVTAKVLPSGHVYESVFVGGIFASLLALNLASISASLFLVALCGTGRRSMCANFILLLILVAAFIPMLVQLASSWIPDVYDSGMGYFNPQASGLFWQNSNTEQLQYAWSSVDNTTIYETCHRPIMTEFQGKWYKTLEEQEQVRSDEFFVGCYMSPSWSVRVWKQNPVTERLFMFFFPYFHFNTIWGNFVGYTAMPDRTFTLKQFTMSTEELALAALPQGRIDPTTTTTTTMAPQGSMFVTDHYYDYDNYWDATYKNTCPFAANTTSTGDNELNFCDNVSDCGYAQDPGAQYGSPSAADAIGMLFGLSVLYLILAAYWATVFCSGNGKGEPWYFWVRPSYWWGSGNGTARNHHQEEHPPLTDDGQETNRNKVVDHQNGVTITGLKKSYGPVEAVKGVSFQMNPGEVTALLGHNGAGKTTLSSILCCEIAGTEGDIRVFGHSVFSEPYAVRGMVGLCKQDDYLWPNLSAKEHLELFAGLRGVSSSILPQTVQKWLDSVDLDDVQFQYAGAYSGGMKRRLSLALATIGDRPLIVLDEPTTGMDPVSRRFVWRHIDSIKEGRVILLTTHAMEEADLLADEVAIMRKGELAAFGSPLQLKTEYGTALQFSILVYKSRLEEATEYIDDFFAESDHWVHVVSSPAGNITVKIAALEDHNGGQGVKVQRLASFVAWLDSKESPVSEYGFSNSSLEEVFLKVTEGDEENDDGCDRPDSETRTVPNDEDVEAAQDSRTDEEVAHFQANLKRMNQSLVIFWSFWRRGWTGRGSIGNYFMFGSLLIGNITLMVGIGRFSDPTPSLPVVIAFMSFLMVAIIGPVYADRFEGQFYLMKSQGLLPAGYIAGLSLYAFTVQFAYNLFTLTGIFATPLFRESELCEVNEFGYCDYDVPGYGGKQQVSDPVWITNLIDTYNDQPVILKAYRAPGGYGMVFGVAVAAAFAMVGQTLSSAFFPGYRLPLLLVMFCTLVVSTLPLLPILLQRSEETYMDCSNTTNPEFYCDGDFSREEIDADFVNCVGFQANEIQAMTYCTPPFAALLSHFGIYQMLAMAYSARITFISEPKGYVRDVLIPSLDGAVKCQGDTCSFPFANRLYGMNFLFTILGGVILCVIGISMAYILAFPVGPILRMRQEVSRLLGLCTCFWQSSLSEDSRDETDELAEVGEERTTVEDMVRPLLTTEHQDGETAISSIINNSAIPRSDIAPIVTHRLRKVYPALGGRPPKLALESLDLHVPKGEVIGLLGKNGAGKTTALKILAGAQDASGGFGIVAGYDCESERISVFERLGNCAQFDVVWKDQSVQRHLEFFAALKGLPKTEIKAIARAIADAVGLGSHDVYARAAGALSGGMRRRLSIGMALIGSPAVVILDEPTTGLDPSTRSSIWSLINSFASQDRSMIITTHMMIEADTLCNRIAIISRGKLRVIGTQQHLKNTYGDGYLLQLNLVHSSPQDQERAMAFVRKYLHPKATLRIRQAKTLHVNLPRDIQLDKVFQALYGKERTIEGGINQFLLSQSSLEDVFIALGD